MFQKGYAKARHFTRASLVCIRKVDGTCGSGLAAFVVINREGWILTAWHHLKQCLEFKAAAEHTTTQKAAIAAIKSDQTLSAKVRSRQLAEKKLNSDAVQNYVSWWGHNACQVTDIHFDASVDLAIGRLVPFDPSWVDQYPTIKDPSKDYEPGVSLCKLGFPFYDPPIGWDDKANQFVAKDGAEVKFPLFPIEGMLTRFIVDPAWPTEGAYPRLHIETSSPGLRGQSGGPIFDTEGRVWAIQSATASLPLGFEPEVKVKGGIKHREHQFLNVGRGVHAAIIVGLLNQHGVKFELS